MLTTELFVAMVRSEMCLGYPFLRGWEGDMWWMYTRKASAAVSSHWLDGNITTGMNIKNRAHEKK